MKEIKRTATNAAFLQEAQSRGYGSFVDSSKNDPDYLGSIQKRLADESGTFYFINMNMFDISRYRLPEGASKLMVEIDLQFHTEPNLEGRAVNLKLSFTEFDADEAFIQELWSSGPYAHYQLDTPCPSLG